MINEPYSNPSPYHQPAGPPGIVWGCKVGTGTELSGEIGDGERCCCVREGEDAALVDVESWDQGIANANPGLRGEVGGEIPSGVGERQNEELVDIEFRGQGADDAGFKCFNIAKPRDGAPSSNT